MSKIHKTIIFTEFSKMANILHRELKIYKPLLITGDVPQEKRQDIVKLFNENNNYQILIMTSAGAYGLNLQAASSVIHYDLPWSISRVTQREDRAHRIGQNKNVVIYRMIVKNSIDEYVLNILHQKQKTAELILGDRDRLRKSRVSRATIQKLLQ